MIFDAAQELPFYSHHAQELEGSVGAKIRILVETDKIEYVKTVGHPGEENYAAGYWLIHNIPGYNTRTYTVKGDREFGFTCNCQAWVSRNKRFATDPAAGTPTCAHVGAVYEFLARMNRVKKQEKVKTALLTMF